MVRLDPVTIAVDRDAPLVTVSLTGRRLAWHAEDHATPWVRLSLRLDRPNRRRWIALGLRALEGELRLPRLHVRWEAKLFVSDSSGNRTRVDLGTVGGS
jgi:hypothetical protein